MYANLEGVMMSFWRNWLCNGKQCDGHLTIDGHDVGFGHHGPLHNGGDCRTFSVGYVSGRLAFTTVAHVENVPESTVSPEQPPYHATTSLRSKSSSIFAI